MEDSALVYLNYVQAYLIVMSNLANSPKVTSIYSAVELRTDLSSAAR
jgi:hypothetical protein